MSMAFVHKFIQICCQTPTKPSSNGVPMDCKKRGTTYDGCKNMNEQTDFSVFFLSFWKFILEWLKKVVPLSQDKQQTNFNRYK